MTDLGDDVDKDVAYISVQDIKNMRQDTKSRGQSYTDPSDSKNCYCGFVVGAFIVAGTFMYYGMGGADEKILGGILAAGGLITLCASIYPLRKIVK